MLRTSVSKTVTGTSLVNSGDVDMVVASMSASIHEDGNVNINKTIVNRDLYNANKEIVRSDMEAFEVFVYDMED